MVRDKIKLNIQRNSKPIQNYPELFAVSEGDIEGEIDLQWDPVTDARFYIIQISIYSGNLNWVQFDIITKSSYTLSGLKSKKRYCFRVCAVNSGGNGPWSEIICKVAP